VKEVEQANQKLKIAFEKLEDAISHYQDLLQKEINKNQNMNESQTIKSLKVLLHEKRHFLDPTITFEDISDHNVCDLSSSIPSGHVVTLFYTKHPIRKQTIYHSNPVNLKPWLSFRLRNLS
jgi:hypothetical protein